jgi:hypothetical protein
MSIVRLPLSRLAPVLMHVPTWLGGWIALVSFLPFALIPLLPVVTILMILKTFHNKVHRLLFAHLQLLAYVVSIVGGCRVKLGQLDEGRECIETAIRMFEDLKLFAEVPRVRKGLVDIAVARGRYNEAISELYKMRNAFMALHLPIIAALVELDVVDLLMLSGRTADIPALGKKMLATFSEAGLRRNALMALAHIQALAQDGALASDDVQKARAFLERLSGDPDAAFTTSA